MVNRFLLRAGLLGMTLALAAYDPALFLTFRNQRGQPVRLSVTTSWDFRSDTTTVTTLQPKGHGRHSKEGMYFGIGGWTDTVAVRVARHFKQIKIASRTDSMSFNNAAEIQKLFLSSRKRGFAKHEMVIDIK